MALCYKDITYCARPCKNMKCEINIKHLEGVYTHGLPVSQAIFDKCEKWREEDEPRESN